MRGELALKSLLLLAFVGVVVRALRPASAAVRHRVLAMGFAALACLPLLAARVPTIDVPTPRPSLSHDSGAVQPATLQRTIDLPVTGRSAMPSPVSPQPFPEPRPSHWPATLVALWGLGTLASLGAFLFRLLQAFAVALGRGEDLAVEARFAVPPHTRVRRTDVVDVPMTLGLLRPTILLPVASADWSDERLRAVLLHECAHIRRGDWAWLVFGRLVAAAYWFNPLVWWAASRMCAEGELAADDAVLRAGVPATGYAETLVDLAASLRRNRPEAVLPIVERTGLKARVAEILRAAKPRNALTLRSGLLLLGLSTLVVLPFAGLRLVARTPAVRNGILDFGSEGRLEIVAITEMRGERARSWDVRGALLPSPYKLASSEEDYLRAASANHPSGPVVRYVVIRCPEGDNSPVFSDPKGNPLPTTGIQDDVVIGGTDYQRSSALGGSLVAVRLDLPAGTRAAPLGVAYSVGAWRTDAYETFDRGDMRSMSGSVAFDISPAMPGKPWKSVIAFTVPSELSGREVRVQAFPSGQPSYYRVEAGRQTLFSDVPAEAVRRVELASRPTLRAEFSDLPMLPDPGAAYTLQSFRPPGLILAREGRATLPDGRRLSCEGVWDASGRGWTGNGAPLAGRAPKVAPSPIPGLRALRFVFAQEGSAVTSSPTFYDGEGRGVLSTEGYVIFHPGGRQEFGFVGLVEPERRELNLTLRFSAGPYRLIAQGVPNRMPGWSARYSSGKDDRGLRVDYPPSLMGDQRGEDWRFVPLDASSREVKSGADYSFSQDWVRFPVMAEVAKRIAAVRIESRPFVWVRFPKVRLDPSERP